jgi:hypothetical protein
MTILIITLLILSLLIMTLLIMTLLIMTLLVLTILTILNTDDITNNLLCLQLILLMNGFTYNRK